MKINKKLIALITTGVLSVSMLTGCSGGGESSSNEVKKVGITQLV